MPEYDVDKKVLELAQAHVAASLSNGRRPRELTAMPAGARPDVIGLTSDDRRIGIEVAAATEQSSKQAGVQAVRFLDAVKRALESKGESAVGSIAIAPPFHVSCKSVASGLPLLVDRVKGMLVADESWSRPILAPGVTFGTEGILGLSLEASVGAIEATSRRPWTEPSESELRGGGKSGLRSLRRKQSSGRAGRAGGMSGGYWSRRTKTFPLPIGPRIWRTTTVIRAPSMQSGS